MSKELPAFRYHPDPLATGSVKSSDSVCRCCGKARGYVYAGPVYGRLSPEDPLCPWCIASGLAASKYNCFFVDARPLEAARLSPAIILEVTRKTPGYSSWQENDWQACCDDACEFRGDASKQELAGLAGNRLASQLQRWRLRPDRWQQLLAAYQPGGMVSIFRFVCRHCGGVIYGLDVG